MKENTFDKERRCHIAALSLGLIDALKNGAISTDAAQKLLFRPGIFFKYEDDAEIFRLLNLGEELCWTVWDISPEIREVSVKEIKDLCLKILSEDGKDMRYGMKYSKGAL